MGFFFVGHHLKKGFCGFIGGLLGHFLIKGFSPPFQKNRIF